MHEDNFLLVTVIIIAIAVVVVAIFKRLKLSPVLGYFVAGGLIGEHGLNVVSSSDIKILGEVGIVFLLFAIGLELTFERLKAMRGYVFGFGGLQVIITAITIGAIAIGINLDMLSVGLSASVIVGGGLALSSTAIVLQVIAENRQQSTQVGRLSLAVLLMQDFAVVPLLVIIPILAGEQAGIIKPLGEALGKAVIALIVIFILGRILLRPLFRVITANNVSKANELFIATTLLIALGTAWITNNYGLSLALGAFVAGLLVAETEFQLLAEESIAPFKALLLGLFFMSVGMTIDMKVVISNLPEITLLSLGIIVVKATILTVLCICFRFSLGVSINTGLLLSQGGEFAFILFRLADEKGIIDEELGQMLLLVVTITMALTPLLAIIGSWIADKLDNKSVIVKEKIFKEIADLANHVIVLGFGRVGKMVAKILEAENVNYIALDIDSEYVMEKRKEGFPVYLGDASSIEMLKAVGIERSSSVIVAIENKIITRKATKVIRKNFPALPIVVRSEDLKEAKEYYESGATIIVPECYETGLQLGGAVLKSVGISEFEVSRIKNQFRAVNYANLPDPDELNKDNITKEEA
jgi:monovalent cation:H+ antiporter-2, CPA2 family